jgi:hypothetical protein
MTDPAMSPAQKIRKALAERYCCEPDDIPTSMCEMESVACIVLRAAADEVVPENLSQCKTYTNEAIRLNRQGIRCQLFAIAAELEAKADA